MINKLSLITFIFISMANANLPFGHATWNVSYDWDCTGDATSSNIIFDEQGRFETPLWSNHDGTYTYNEYTGVYTHQYDYYATAYVGRIRADHRITGVMYRLVDGSSGCFTMTPGSSHSKKPQAVSPSGQTSK